MPLQTRTILGGPESNLILLITGYSGNGEGSESNVLPLLLGAGYVKKL